MFSKSFLSRSRTGEIIRHSSRYLKEQQKPDTVFDRQIFAMIVMLLCATMDAFTFNSLFCMINYDNFFMRIIQVGSFLLGCDVVPVFLGIRFRRLKLNLTKNCAIIYLGLVACLLTFGLNTTLRITTIDELSPKTTVFDSYISQANPSAETVEETTYSSKDIATTIFGCVMPLVTSLASFYVSYTTFEPLLIRKNRLDRLLAQKKEEIRLLKALQLEYENHTGLEAQLLRDEEIKFNALCDLEIAKALSACDYVDGCIKKHLGTESAYSALSTECSSDRFARFKRELAMFLQAPALNAKEPSISFVPTVQPTFQSTVV